MPPRIEQTLFELRSARPAARDGAPRTLPGRPDRPARAEQLGRSAALLVDLAALEGAHGRPAMKTARRLLEEGLAHAAATDIHAPEDQRAIAAGMAWIRKRLGARDARPVAGREPAPYPRGRASLTGGLEAVPRTSSRETPAQAADRARRRRDLRRVGAARHRPRRDLPSALARVSLPVVSAYLVILALTHSSARLALGLPAASHRRPPALAAAPGDLLGGVHGHPGPAGPPGRVRASLLRRAHGPIAHERRAGHGGGRAGGGRPAHLDHLLRLLPRLRSVSLVARAAGRRLGVAAPVRHGPALPGRRPPLARGHHRG